MKLQLERRCGVAVLEPQPIVIEGLRSILAASGNFWLLEPTQSLESLTRLLISSAPHVAIVDKSVSIPAIVDWLDTSGKRACSSIIVWAASLNDGEALRLLKAGVRGVIRKTADPATLLACLDAVSTGATWMEEELVSEKGRRQRANRLELTCREQQVLDLVEQGMRNKEIAAELGIRPGTVKIHLRHIFEKSGVHGRFGLALSGLRNAQVAQRLAS